MTLGRLIRLLEAEPQDNTVCFAFGGFTPRRVASYRGYYDECALSYDDDWRKEVKVSDLLTELRSAIGKEFQGWKGGGYVMSADTPIWAANAGECSGTLICGLAECSYKTVIETKYDER